MHKVFVTKIGKQRMTLFLDEASFFITFLFWVWHRTAVVPTFLLRKLTSIKLHDIIRYALFPYRNSKTYVRSFQPVNFNSSKCYSLEEWDCASCWTNAKKKSFDVSKKQILLSRLSSQVCMKLSTVEVNCFLQS